MTRMMEMSSGSSATIPSSASAACLCRRCQTDENAEEDRILEQLVHFFASFPFLITNCVIQPEAPITTKVLTTVTTIYWNHALPIS